MKSVEAAMSWLWVSIIYKAESCNELDFQGPVAFGTALVFALVAGHEYKSVLSGL